jgi:membrane protein implicated in regulation of membrane protease activity
MDFLWNASTLWLLLGLALVVIELMTGTFYLLVLALGAFAAAITAFLGGGVVVQALTGGVVACIGTWFVHRWHKTHTAQQSADAQQLDIGQAVVFERWVDAASARARVRYRGTSWDAQMELSPSESAAPAENAHYVILRQEGGLLIVGNRPLPRGD